MSNQPSYEVFQVIETEKVDPKTMKPMNFWQKIGAAWQNRDGSINGHLNSLPVDGKFQLRKPKEASTS